MFTLILPRLHPNKICKTGKDPTTNKHLFKWSHSHHDHCDGINAWGTGKKVDVCKKGFPNN